jgi:glycosyltransferase involved in cell wall biosynthesis
MTGKADALKEIIRVHQAIEKKYGLDKKQNRYIDKRYRALIKGGRLKKISRIKRTKDLIESYQAECVRLNERIMQRSLFQPKVSIVIPVFNGSNYMREAIESALAQTYPNIEVIVVNDGSTDNGMTDAIDRSYGNKIRYFKKENGGVATALNFGIEKMEGEYFAWLSHDDIFDHNKILNDIETLNQLEDKTTFLAGGYTVINEFGKRLYDVNLLNQFSQEELSKPLFVVFRGGINGCTTLIHKSHFERAGVFDPALPTTQDYDLWFRMLRGQRLHYYNACNVKSRIHEQQGSRRVGNHVAECNRLWIRMMSSITDEERKKIDGSQLLFYANTAKFLQKSTDYAEAF